MVTTKDNGIPLRRVVPVGEVCFDHGRVLLTYGKETAESLSLKISADREVKAEFEDILQKIQEADVSMEPEHWAGQQNGIGIKMKSKQAFVSQTEAERALKGRFSVPGLQVRPTTLNGPDGQPVTGVLCDPRGIPSDVRFDMCTVYAFTERMHKTNHVTPHNTFRKGQALERHEASCRRVISDRPPALQVTTTPPSFQLLVQEMQRAQKVQSDAAEAAGLIDAADVEFVGGADAGEFAELPQAPMAAVVKRPPSRTVPSPTGGAQAGGKRQKRGSPPAGARVAGGASGVKKDLDKDGLLLSLDVGASDPLDDVEGIMQGIKVGREMKGVKLGKK